MDNVYILRCLLVYICCRGFFEHDRIFRIQLGGEKFNFRSKINILFEMNQVKRVGENNVSFVWIVVTLLYFYQHNYIFSVKILY